jgi:hypothetical protein
MPAETYASTAYGAVRRIRTPHAHDVLSGRGGGINSHVGNQNFRHWVAERKEDYNLAPNKQEKTQIAMEVMDKVRNQSPPGRFLRRDPTAMSGPGWWIEVDEARALAKTSQALREGAPQIRLAHKEELSQSSKKEKRSSGKRKRKATTDPRESVPKQSAPVVPGDTPPSRSSVPQMPADEYNRAIECLQANVQQAKELTDQQEKMEQGESSPQQQRQQFWDPVSKTDRLMDERASQKHYEVPAVDDLAETPPLLSMPPPPERMESLSLVSPYEPKEAYHQTLNLSTPPTRCLPRVHSLALSDFSTSDTNVLDGDGEFINPFEDESNIASKVKRSRQISNGNKRYPTDYLRNLSSDDSINPVNGLDRYFEVEYPRYVLARKTWYGVRALGCVDSVVLSHKLENGQFPHNFEHNLLLTQPSFLLIPKPFSADRSIGQWMTDENDPDEVFHGSWETDFGEGMKSILDIIHPDLTSPELGEKLPTLLFPWRGAGNNCRRTSVSSSSRGLYDGRQ